MKTRLEASAGCGDLTGKQVFASGGVCYEYDELAAAFKKVSDPKDWRGPIDVLITFAEMAVVSAAIEFFTATQADIEIQSITDQIARVRSIGYRAGPAGDH